ncbi:hypothetical protein [Rhizobium hidalgonense]|uniref:Uncharacterized protein n=1 Tax=Rhizobium hidalgonense TaxID=1538159 RepID=A0AAJ2LMU3_9HYPH|nr:hypothetical protein [Rhizobium hidalgonense]MDR9775098.1 hypothetical protein [Rhizobium hidalgonense]MDR9806449.1 hypothetical protein [Rhizobium hidalgonense]MDR9813419.1 hypothetical protein [Rhizobium hidalgonense]MDR9822342.1 hypothetical protein [Rhizobium hidalgonense]QKK21845.1 hypothetical protein FFM81_013010 [Rhizobium hidalgonense]
MADSEAVEIRRKRNRKTMVNVGSVHSRFAAGRKPATDVGNLPHAHVRSRKMTGREKARVYKDLNENLVNRKILLECSKNAKKADDKAQCLS